MSDNRAMNREGWLTAVAMAVRPVFKPLGLPDYRVTCGWPSRRGLGVKSRVVGECHGISSTPGNIAQIFISPLIAEPLEVAGTLCHELAHAVAGSAAGHGPGYVKVCRAVGLTEGRPTVVMPGEILRSRLSRVVERLGPYPHVAMTPRMKAVKPGEKAVTLSCPDCGCVVRITADWLEDAGPPLCGCHCGRPMTPKERRGKGE